MIQNILTQLIRVAVIKRYTPILTFPLKGGRNLKYLARLSSGTGVETYAQERGDNVLESEFILYAR